MINQINQASAMLVQQWINTHLKNKLCQVCGSDKSLILSDLVEMPIVPVPIPNKKYVYIQVMCNECGNTIFINQTKVFPVMPALKDDPLPDKELDKYK